MAETTVFPTSYTKFPGGNLLRAFFRTGDADGLSVYFTGPIGMNVAFGDGGSGEIGDTGIVDHVYAAPEEPRPWVVRAVLTDASDRLRGTLRFEVPHRSIDPIAVQSAPFGAGVR
jgi:hypothetical protein